MPTPTPLTAARYAECRNIIDVADAWIARNQGGPISPFGWPGAIEMATVAMRDAVKEYEAASPVTSRRGRALLSGRV